MKDAEIEMKSRGNTTVLKLHHYSKSHDEALNLKVIQLYVTKFIYKDTWVSWKDAKWF